MTDDKSATADAATVQPLDTDGVTAAIVGTAVFALGIVVTLLMRDSLSAQGDQWWSWVCVVGVVIGLLLTAYTIRRRAVYRAARNKAGKG